VATRELSAREAGGRSAGGRRLRSIKLLFFHDVMDLQL